MRAATAAAARKNGLDGLRMKPLNHVIGEAPTRPVSGGAECLAHAARVAACAAGASLVLPGSQRPFVSVSVSISLVR